MTPQTYRRLTALVLVAVGFIIVTGGAVRLTDSGLGCPKWPACTGHSVVPALGYHKDVEFVNRVVTGLVSVAVALVAVASYLRQPRRPDLTWLGGGLVLGLVAQIVLGGETVRHRLEPGFVMAHFLLSILIVWDAVVLHHRAGFTDGGRRRALAAPEVVWIARVVAVMALITIVVGTIVTGSGPHSGANAGDGQVTRWQLSLHRITQLHGAAAMILVALSLGLVWVLRSCSAPEVVMERAYTLVSALGAQVVIGYTQYFTGVPAWLVAFHILGAVLVWMAALRLALVLASGGVVVAEPVPVG